MKKNKIMGENQMNIKDEILGVKKECEEIREKALALEVLDCYKKENVRLRRWIIFVVTMWMITLSYLICLLYRI